MSEVTDAQEAVMKSLQSISESYRRYSEQLDRIHAHAKAVGVLRSLMSQGKHCPIEAIDKAIEDVRCAEKAMEDDSS